MELNSQGILEKYNVEMIGAKPEAIEKVAREVFKQAMLKIGMDVVAPLRLIIYLMHSKQPDNLIGEFPIIIRPSYTLVDPWWYCLQP